MATILESTEDPAHNFGSKLRHVNGMATGGASRLARAATSETFWRSPAMQKLCRDSVSPTEFWKRFWKLRRPKPVAKLCRCAGTPLAWGLHRKDLTPACGELLSVVDGARGHKDK